jgi:DNA recombination protein RmuC
LTQSNETSIENVRKTVDERLQDMQASNEKKLDQMRKTVDEQLQSTLEKRLGESFSIVSKNLEVVQRGLGEMQNLATGVGDLKRVLTNVKARGTWGEVQLGSLLEEVLTPDQYSKNAQVRENSRERVEYAIRLPGSNDGPDSCVWLPIDSKFPLADYERLVDAADVSDASAVQEATQAFIRAVQAEAKKIRDKYIAPPMTTDFAIMFLPTEGLYAEALRAPGLVTELLQRYRIVIAGPTTLAAILSSLRMGFRTLAIEKHSSEVWEVLAAAKTEFDQFGDVMDKLKDQLDTVSNTIDKTGVRRRAIERKLRTVEALPPEEAAARLGLPDSEQVIN